MDSVTRPVSTHRVNECARDLTLVPEFEGDVSATAGDVHDARALRQELDAKMVDEPLDKHMRALLLTTLAVRVQRIVVQLGAHALEVQSLLEPLGARLLEVGVAHVEELTLVAVLTRARVDPELAVNHLAGCGISSRSG